MIRPRYWRHLGKETPNEAHMVVYFFLHKNTLSLISGVRESILVHSDSAVISTWKSDALKYRRTTSFVLELGGVGGGGGRGYSIC